MLSVLRDGAVVFGSTVVDPTSEATTQTSGFPLVVVIGGLVLAGLGLAAVAQEFRNWRSRRE